MSEFKIGRGNGFPPCLLKDAKFSRATADGNIYCYISTLDGVKTAFTRHQVFKLSLRGGKYVARLRNFLKNQDGWNAGIWEEKECEKSWPSEEEKQQGQRLITELLNESGRETSGE